MNYTSEDLCVCFLCFMLGYLFCQNMMGTEGVRDGGHDNPTYIPGGMVKDPEEVITDDTSGHRNPDRGCWDPKSGLPMESPLQHVC